MVVRELVALLGVKTDTASLKKAESSISGLGGTLQGIAGTFGNLFKTVGLTFGVFKAVDWVKNIIADTSSATENLNVLDVAFKENKDSVIAWSDDFSKAAGRSKYDMQQMAGTLGSVLNPLMDGNTKAAADMSKGLSELVVDLGSLYEKMEPEVLNAFRSGVTGEAEPLKRFGVVMNEATLKAFAMRNGITKNIKTMSIAEKTQLRYNFILEATKIAHGDAIKTSKSYANVSKALGARIKDFGIAIGLKLLPTLEKLIPAFIEIMEGSGGFADVLGSVLRVGFKVIEWAVKFISYIFKLVRNMDPARQKILLFGTALIAIAKMAMSPWGKWALIIGAIVLIVDDFISFMEGGESVIGKFNDALKETLDIDLREFFQGVGMFLDDLADKSKDSSDTWNKLWYEAVLVVENYISMAAQTWSNWLGDSWAATQEFFSWVTGLFSGWIDSIVNWFSGLFDNTWGAWVSISLQSIAGFFISIREYFSGWSDGLSNWFSSITEQFITWAKSLPGKIRNAFGGFSLWSLLGKGGQKVQANTTGTQTTKNTTGTQTTKNITETIESLRGISSVGTVEQVMSPKGVKKSQTTVNNTNDMRTKIDVHVKGTPGMSAEKLAESISVQMVRELDRRQREAMKTLVPQSAT